MQALMHNLKTLFLVIGVIVILFLPAVSLYKLARFCNLQEVNDLKYRIKSLEHYKHVCITKTKWQHEINIRHGAVVDYFLENEPDLKPAFDLNEIKDKKAE